MVDIRAPHGVRRNAERMYKLRSGRPRQAEQMIRAVSLFCGIGNADAGLYAAAERLGVEVRVVAAYDSWDKAVAVYNQNMPHPVAQVADVKQMTQADLPPHDLVIGGPPCQAHSLAGLRKCKCNVGGHVDPTCCLSDFLRLAGDTPYLMENVVPRLINAPFSIKLNAFHYGDVTSRKRWFYSTHLLHVIDTPGPRRFGHIRDHEADRITLAKRAADIGMVRKPGDTRGARTKHLDKVTTYAEDDALGSLTAHAWHGHDVRSSAKLVAVRDDDPVRIVTHRPRINTAGCEPYATWVEGDGVLGSLTADTAHNTSPEVLVRGRGRNGNIAMKDEPVFGSLTGESGHRGGPLVTDDDVLGTLTSGKGGSSGFLKVGLRGHSASASAFEDDEPLGSLVANAWHGNEIGKLGPGVRCPSLLEMARAHSIPDDFDWCKTTKTARGKMIANSWPRMMATAVCSAMLVAMGAARLERAS